jgi:hypothetical protein
MRGSTYARGDSVYSPLTTGVHAVRPLPRRVPTPRIRELWIRQHLTPQIRELDQRRIDVTADRVCAAFETHAPLFTDLAPLHCRVAAHTLERLMQVAVDDDEQADQTVVDDARTMLTGYVAGLPETASRRRRAQAGRDRTADVRWG